MMCCLMVTFLTACSQENDPFPQGEGTKGNSITLKLSTGIQFQTRAEAAGAEVAVSHLDVFIFDANETMQYYERFSNCTDQQGTVTLAASKDDFDANTGYYVYLLANSTHTEAEFKNLANLSALKAMTQEDERIHITGLSNVEVAPKTFLMDGIAYSGEQEPQAATPVVLNDGNPSSDTELKVMLRRAAAKIIIHVKKGDAVTFDDKPARDYYLRNMPYSTSLLAGVDGEAKLRTSMKSNTSYYEWNEDGTITLTAYTYAHDWADASAFEKEVRLVVNIPLKYNDTDYSISYYQIPVCEDKVLERNTCYEVTVTVSAPGGTDPSAPAELSDISYSVTPWNEKEVGIGGDDEHPIYLYVNEEEMEMHNITDDNTTLEFASSSAVSATVTRVYYIDKFGQEQDESTSTVTATPDPDLNGNIKIHSPLPTNNTIRYIEMTVTNTDKATPKTVTIAQYPLEYITNILGWYSYRDDFEGTTYELLKGEDVKGETYTSSNRIQDWICGCTWSSINNSWSYDSDETGFFGSKVAGPVATSGSNAGKAHIYYYRWTEKGSGWWGNNPPYTYSVSNGSDVWRNYANPRMYHVRITASSGDYTIGNPRITDGKTDPNADNAQLVSPSFMIASQLGAVQDADNVDIAASHCEQYVEVYKDTESGETIHLRDWRLPTEAELKIIMKFQYSSDAMDEVLAGRTYWSASGLVRNNHQGVSGDNRIRCVRDAYETK
jgi:hypothetical protein